MHAYTHTHLHACVCVYIYIYMYYVCIYIYVYIYIYDVCSDVVICAHIEKENKRASMCTCGVELRFRD